jgi:dipeptidyl aminopeptidase/acylaminoacyl peptidase
MSGNVALRSFAVKPAIPAVVIWAGAVYSYADREKYGISDASYQPSSNINQRQNLRKVLFDTYGNATASAQNVFWKQMAPTSYLGELRGAIQLDHAVDDAVVSISYSRDLNALLDKTHVPHQFYEYPSGGHNISDANFSLAMQRTVEFFKKYLSVND